MIFEILTLAALAHLVVDFIQDLGIEQFNRKPFNCNLCMGYWLALLPGFIEYGVWGMPFAALVGLTSELIYRILQRI